MCMTLAAATPDGFLIAADRRWTSTFTDGSRRAEDKGGKVARLDGGGAVAASGDGMMLDHVLKALQALESPTLETVRTTILQAWHGLAPLIRAKYPDAEPERTCFTIVLPDGERWASYQIMADGTEPKPGAPDMLRICFPPELGHAAVVAAFGALSKALGRHPFDRWGRVVSAAILRLSASAPSMSPTSDIIVHEGAPHVA